MLLIWFPLFSHLLSENIASDCFHGCFVVTCTLCAFISLVWLREQILHGGGPDWLEQDVQGGQARVSIACFMFIIIKVLTFWTIQSIAVITLKFLQMALL